MKKGSFLAILSGLGSVWDLGRRGALSVVGLAPRFAPALWSPPILITIYIILQPKQLKRELDKRSLDEILF